MVKTKVSILMKQNISGAYEDLNKDRKIRYNKRLELAKDNYLNFRLYGQTIKRYGIMKETLQVDKAICLVCNQKYCSCMIAVTDTTTHQLIKMM